MNSVAAEPNILGLLAGYYSADAYGMTLSLPPVGVWNCPQTAPQFSAAFMQDGN